MKEKNRADLKILEFPIKKGLPKYCEYLLFFCLSLLLGAILYSALRTGGTIFNKREYEQVIEQNSDMNSSLMEMENRMKTIDSLKATFDIHQDWIGSNKSITKIWDAILRSFPEKIAVQEASLKAQGEELKLRVKFQSLRPVEKTKPTNHFIKNLSERGYTFQLKGEGRAKKKSYFFEGTLEEEKKSA